VVHQLLLPRQQKRLQQQLQQQFSGLSRKLLA
jgi:hypothetical protein